MKARICLFLTLCLLLCTPMLPTAAQNAPALQLNQTELCEPGQPVTLTLSLCAPELAGGFFTLQYDASLFLLTEITLLQATDTLTLTYKDHGGSVNVLLDAAQNVHVDGALLSLRFDCSEETQPGSYPVICTVPESTSFYALAEDGSAYALDVSGCGGTLTLSEPALPACPVRYLACQETSPQNGSISVRLCALVQPDATLARGSYGFTVSITDQDGTRELTLGGSELLTQIDGGEKTYTAAELGGNLYTAALTVPDQGTVTVTLTPYVRLNDQILYAGTYTLHYQNGVYVNTTS